MKFQFILLSLFFMSISQNSTAQSLDDYQWKNRIVLLVDASFDTDALQSQLAELTSDKNALNERDLIIFGVTPDAVYAADGSPSKLKAKRIFEDCGLDSDFKGTLLLGKDGGVKLKKPFEVPAQQIFERIDGMPMRRAEMIESTKNEPR